MHDSPTPDSLPGAPEKAPRLPLPDGPTPPRQLGQYLLLEKIGQGGMGAVYKAMHHRLKRVVALKVLPPHCLDDPNAVARFQREMEAIGHLDHPCIIRATDAGEADGQHFLVMEYHDGIDLARLVQRHGPLPVADACTLAWQAAIGLQYLHDRGLIHRDVKPSNLLVTTVGQLKLLDLGLARFYGEPYSRERLTASNQAMGTADYMAPEQADDARQADIRSDIYSLGCTLYKLLTGRAPFSGPEYDSVFKKIMAHAHAPVPPIHTWRPEVPEGLVAVIERMLAKEPDERYALPAQVADALEPFMSGGNLAKLVASARARAGGEVAGPTPPDAALGSSMETRPQGPLTPMPGSPIGFSPGITPKLSRLAKPARWTALAAILLVILVGSVFLVNSFLAKRATDQDRGKDPAGPENLEPSVWHHLLRQPPTEELWVKQSRQNRYIPDTRKQEILVYSEDEALFGLGQVRAGGYQFHVTIVQPGMMGGIGGVGIFFGLHDDFFKDKPCKKCQTIELCPTMLNKPKEAYSLHRAWKVLQPGPSGQITFSQIEASVHVPELTNQQEILEIIVEHDMLRSVRWCGRDYPELCTVKVNKAFAPQDYLGAFGTWNHRSSNVYRDAYILLFERSQP